MTEVAVRAFAERLFLIDGPKLYYVEITGAGYRGDERCDNSPGDLFR